MTNLKTLIAAGVAAASMTMVAAPASAELAASAAVASSYIFRGVDLGNGSPAVSGDITYSEAGFYAGAWASSGDDSLGSETDYYAGFATEVAGVSVDLSVWNYVYSGDDAVNGGDNFGDFSEVILGLGLGPVSLTIADNVAGASGSVYYAVGYDVDKFSFVVGGTDNTVEDANYAHVDATYAFSDNLSFTLSQVMDEDLDDDLKFVVSYSLPIDL